MPKHTPTASSAAASSSDSSEQVASESRGSAAPQPHSRQSQKRQPRARFAPEYEILLRRLIEMRKQQGLTQAEMAEALGKTQSHVSMCENRERELSLMDCWKWCLALKIPWSQFIREIEAEVTPTLGAS